MIAEGVLSVRGSSLRASRDFGALCAGGIYLFNLFYYFRTDGVRDDQM